MTVYSVTSVFLCGKTEKGKKSDFPKARNGIRETRKSLKVLAGGLAPLYNLLRYSIYANRNRIIWMQI